MAMREKKNYYCRQCGSQIRFDNNCRTNTGKYIPIDPKTLDPHSCNTYDDTIKYDEEYGNRMYFDPWTSQRITQRRWEFIQKRIQADRQAMIEYGRQLDLDLKKLNPNPVNPNQSIIDAFDSGNIILMKNHFLSILNIDCPVRTIKQKEDSGESILIRKQSQEANAQEQDSHSEKEVQVSRV